MVSRRRVYRTVTVRSHYRMVNGLHVGVRKHKRKIAGVALVAGGAAGYLGYKRYLQRREEQRKRREAEERRKREEILNRYDVQMTMIDGVLVGRIIDTKDGGVFAKVSDVGPAGRRISKIGGQTMRRFLFDNYEKARDRASIEVNLNGRHLYSSSA